MRRVLGLCLFGLLAGLLPFSAQAAKAFTLGILPIHGAHSLAKSYGPLRTYLEQRLQQPVRIESAVDFVQFQQRTLRGDFDLTITAAHFARLAQKDAGFQALVQFTPDHDSLLIYSSERPLAGVAALRGKQLAVIDRLAITVMAALSYLEEQGLEADRDYRVVRHRTHASVAHSLDSGLSAAAVSTSQGILQVPDDLRGKLVVEKHLADIPAFVFLARPAAPSAQTERLKKLLLEFPATAAGNGFLERIGYTGLVEAGEARMKRADRYLKATRKALAP